MKKAQVGFSLASLAEAPEPKRYMITRTLGANSPANDGFTGSDKYVEFYNGRGVLDILAIQREHPDWVAHDPGRGIMVQVAGVTIEEYAAFWTRRNYTVRKISEQEASEFRTHVENDRRRLDDAEVARRKAES